MPVLLARLAGPLQSWGAEPKLRTASTHPTPTWSAVLGLCRAALGHSQTDDPADIAWLRDLTMAVRVDQPGTARVDFHTINPLPPIYDTFEWVQAGDRGLVPLGTEIQKSGQAPRWLRGTAPMITRRHYLHDAAFLLLIEGPDPALNRLADALTSPRWTLQLGRKGCTPASPVLLGIHPATLREAAAQTPTVQSPLTRNPRSEAPEAAGDLDLVWIHGTPDPTLPVRGLPKVVLDHPLGSHPQHGYAPGQHTTTTIAVTASGDSDLIAWATAHLTHPARPTQETLS